MAKITPIDIDEKDLKSLATQVRKAFQDLAQILINLSFQDNFKRMIWEGTIPANTEVLIPHRLKVVPSGYVVIRRKGGIIEDGDTVWTSTMVSLRNQSSTSDSIAKVVFVA